MAHFLSSNYSSSLSKFIFPGVELSFNQHGVTKGQSIILIAEVITWTQTAWVLSNQQTGADETG